MLQSESGIKKVILVDRTGLIIASVTKFSYFPVEVESIGASASAIFSASEYQAKNLRLGRLLILTCEFSKGKIFTVSCGSKGVIVLISDP
ncbi:MAG: roadblock/LC7 domain-containing protein, partial [Candidatus Hermodarchaeota archaeon]